MNRTKAFTLVELLVVIAIIALLIGLLLPALAKARQNAASLKDKTQISQIHKAALSFAHENKGIMPTPGLINRLNATVGFGGGPSGIPGVGPEDKEKNTTANLYSAMIAQELITPAICYGTTEVNNFIAEYKGTNENNFNGYDYAKYNPAGDTYWDDGFKANPTEIGCNSSYAHMALSGERKRVKWRDSQDATIPAFGTRGTGGSYMGIGKGGAVTGDDYAKSPTLQLHGPKKQWYGHVLFSDNHAETLDTFFSPLCTYVPRDPTLLANKDNIYSAEFDDFIGVIPGATQYSSGDAFLGMFISTDDEGLNTEPRWDILED